MYSVSPQTPFCQIDGAEAATSDQVATIIGHADILAWRGLMVSLRSTHPTGCGVRASVTVMMIARSTPKRRPSAARWIADLKADADELAKLFAELNEREREIAGSVVRLQA
jgi:hypothetical protein